jgi:hypothetical protein
MATVPKGRIDRVRFYQSHVSVWAAHAQALGTSDERVAELAAITAEARQAYQDQLQAQSAARAATQRFNELVRQLRQSGSSIMKQIHGQAGQAGDGIYALASISVPKDRSPIGPPGTPTAFRAELDAIGWLTLTWKCRNPRGTEGVLYRVSRAVGETGRLVVIGHSGKKKFVDETVPRGVESVTYEILPVRSTGEGKAAYFTVNFGTGEERPRTLQQARPWQFLPAA